MNISRKEMHSGDCGISSENLYANTVPQIWTLIDGGGVTVADTWQMSKKSKTLLRVKTWKHFVLPLEKLNTGAQIRSLANLQVLHLAKRSTTRKSYT